MEHFEPSMRSNSQAIGLICDALKGACMQLAPCYDI
jgi:hypothetical protein